MTLYNDIDPSACAWINRLIDCGMLPAGDVVCSDISSISANGGVTTHFFAGIGGWQLALDVAGVGRDDPVWTGSCPCQPFSPASNSRRAGFSDERDLWPKLFEHIKSGMPAMFFGEQVDGPDGMLWLERACSDLEGIGYRVGAVVMCSSILGFPRRRRIYFAAHANGSRKPVIAKHAEAPGLQAARFISEEVGSCDVLQGSDGVPAGMVKSGAIKGYGNSVNPFVAGLFVRAFIET